MDPEGRRLLQRVQQETEGLKPSISAADPGTPARVCHCRVGAADFARKSMARIYLKMLAAVGLIVVSQAALAAPNDNSGARSPDKSGIGALAQAGAPATPASPAPAPALDSKTPQDQSAPAASSQSAPAASSNPTSTAAVTKAGPGTTGCGLKYLAAELAGKLKGPSVRRSD